MIPFSLTLYIKERVILKFIYFILFSREKKKKKIHLMVYSNPTFLRNTFKTLPNVKIYFEKRNKRRKLTISKYLSISFEGQPQEHLIPLLNTPIHNLLNIRDLLFRNFNRTRKVFERNIYMQVLTELKNYLLVQSKTPYSYSIFNQIKVNSICNNNLDGFKKNENYLHSTFENSLSFFRIK